MRVAGGNVEADFHKACSSPLILSGVRGQEIDISAAYRDKWLQLAKVRMKQVGRGRLMHICLRVGTVGGRVV